MKKNHNQIQNAKLTCTQGADAETFRNALRNNGDRIMARRSPRSCGKRNVQPAEPFYY